MPNVTVDAPEELHWGISYLREDIQDIKGDIKDLRKEMDRRFEVVHNEIGDLRKEMYNEFTAIRKEMASHLKWTLGTIIAMSGLIMAFIKFVS